MVPTVEMDGSIYVPPGLVKVFNVFNALDITNIFTVYTALIV